MRAVLAILFPWRRTFKELGLKKRWWHRLAVVAFSIALMPILGASWVLAFSSLQPDQSSMPPIQYWAMDTDGNPEQIILGPPVTQAQHDAAMKQSAATVPVGTQVIIEPPGMPINPNVPLKAKVNMPDGTLGEFVGKSEAEITVAWNKALHKAVFTAWLLSFAIAIAMTLASSYLFQSLYRTLLYVVYGSTNDRGPRHGSESA